MKKRMMRTVLPFFLVLLLIFTSCDFLSGSTKTPVSPEDLPAYSGAAYAEVNGNVPEFTDAEKTAARSSYEKYGELDKLGRCGVCVASVGKDLMPTEPRGSIGSVKPTGWPEKVEDMKYEIVDGKYLYNRCHLIGFQLTGENANRQNLITGTRYLNVDGMLPFENMVADYVKETGNHVLYRVSPMFSGRDLVALGVLMEGWSVEDGGAGICFCVFCYNVQPGIVIDYATGNSRLAEDGEPLMPDWNSRIPADADIQQPALQITLLQGEEPVRAGQTASVRIQGTPGCVYSIRVKLPSGSYSNAAALVEQTADKEGIAVWEWRIASGTKPGTATVVVTGNGEKLEFSFLITE